MSLGFACVGVLLRSRFAGATEDHLSPRVERVIACYSGGFIGVAVSERWRRRESNPRPETSQPEPLHVYPAFGSPRDAHGRASLGGSPFSFACRADRVLCTDAILVFVARTDPPGKGRANGRTYAAICIGESADIGFPGFYEVPGPRHAPLAFASLSKPGRPHDISRGSDATAELPCQRTIHNIGPFGRLDKGHRRTCRF